MKPQISSGLSRNSLVGDDRARLRTWIVSGVVTQLLLLGFVLGLSTIRRGIGLAVIAAVVGEPLVLWLIMRGWLGLEQRLAAREHGIRMAQVLTSSLEMDAVASTVVDQVRKAIPAHGILMYQWAGDRSPLHLLAREMTANVLPAQEEAFKQVAATQHPANLTFSESEGGGRWWVIPLSAQGRTVGLLALSEDDDPPLTHQARRLVEGITQLAAVALYNAITFAQVDANLRERIIELSTIEVVSRHISATLDTEVIASDVLAAAMSAIEAEIGSCLLTTNHDEYVLVARIDSQGTQPPAVFDGHQGIVGQVLQTRQPVLVPDVRLDPKNEQLTAGMRAQLGVPILREGQALGVLHLEHSRANAFTETHVRLVNTLADHAAIALENARLYDEIRTGRDQLQAIMDSTRNAMLLFDSRGRLLQFNPVAQDMIGRDLTPYLGRSLVHWLRETGAAHLHAVTGLTLPQLRQMVRELVRQPTCVTHRQFQHVQGESVTHINETGSPVLDQQGNPVGWLLVWRDNTEERKLDMLRQEFSSMMVHDLRNPITSVIGGMSMLRDLFNETPIDRNAVLEVVQIAQDSAENMLNLVQSLLDISRLEQSAVVMDCESLPLADSIDQATASVLGLALAAGITIVTDVPDDLPPVWMDDEMIQRVLINLLDNALRHTPDGGEIVVKADHQPDDNMVTVRVVDTGPGIPPEERSRVFDKFVQLDPQRVLRGHKGTGLGLTFCKMVIEAHRGQIWVEEGAAGGAAFCFTLPLLHLVSAPQGADSP
jgi:NtrC-family two-component system sensor histidine kinase KinB